MTNQSLSIFQELALIYVKAQNLTGKTPEETLEMYQDAYDRICEHEKKIREAR